MGTLLLLTLLAPTSRPLAPQLQAASHASRAITQIEYEGTLIYEGHARHPGDLRAYHFRQQFATDGADRVRTDYATWKDGDTLIVPETWVLVGDRIVHRDAPDKPWEEFAGVQVRRQRFQALAGLPALLLRDAGVHRDSLVDLHMARGRLERYVRRQAHPRLGDVGDSVSFEYAGAEAVPKSISMTLYERDANWRSAGHRTSWSSGPVADSMFALPSMIAPAKPNYEETGTMGSEVPAFTAIASGLWSADLADIDSRTLMVEFTDHLAVIELAVGSANGERIVDAARRRWPDKPIRYALFSHYHPHYTGGLRAVIAENATVITTTGNEAFVRHLAEVPFHLAPDRLARRPRPVKVVTFADRYELEDSTNRLVALNYGPRSNHTDEFVVFWFPRQKLLFESELGWMRGSTGLRPISRARGLLAWADSLHLNIDRLVQSWPMRDNEAMLTRARLDSLVQASKR